MSSLRKIAQTQFGNKSVNPLNLVHTKSPFSVVSKKKYKIKIKDEPPKKLTKLT